jgi:bifunctional DNA-binding transcriptional regulator/antitoxin component of YhaV-PrlF toxin-antitoxin module
MSRNSNKNRALVPVKLASYGTVKVYKSNRIKLDANLLKTLGITAGDPVEVFLDTEERTIVIKGPDKK